MDYIRRMALLETCFGEELNILRTIAQVPAHLPLCEPSLLYLSRTEVLDATERLFKAEQLNIISTELRVHKDYVYFILGVNSPQGKGTISYHPQKNVRLNVERA